MDLACERAKDIGRGLTIHKIIFRKNRCNKVWRVCHDRSHVEEDGGHGSHPP